MAIKTKQWDDGSSATIQYNGQGDGEIIITSDPNEHYEARSMQIVVETTDGSGIQKAITINQAAKQRIDISAAVVTAATQTYSGSAKTPTPTVTLNGTTIPSTGYDVAYSNNINAGTATITVTGKGDYTGTATGTFTINKANPTYTAPSARSLTYSGSAQYLTTTGSTSHGTIQYSSDGTNWYSTRRQGTNAGDYTTYWRLVGDSNHNDVASTSISVTIAQATGQVTTAPTARDVTYTGSSQYLVTAGSGTGTMYYRYKLSTSSSWSSWSTTRPSRTSAGTYNIEYYVAASSDGNYTQSATGSLNVEIKKAASSVTAAPTKKSSLTYNRSTQALVNAGTASGGTMYYKYTTTNSKPTSTSGFSSSIPTRTDAGTYYVWYYVYGDSNHTDTAISSTAISVTIAKATPVINAAPSKATGLSYTGSAQNLLTGGSVKHSSSDSTSVNGTFTYAQGTNAGTYNSLTWSFAPSSSNYNSINGTVSGSVTIDKASRTMEFIYHPYNIKVGRTYTLIVSISAGSNDGEVTLSSTYGHVSINGMNVTGVSVGGEYITATISEGVNYLSAQVRYSPSVENP